MAKARIKNAEAVLKSVRKVFKDTQTQSKVLNEVKDYTVERIKQQTRFGNDLVNGGKQPPLSKEYIQYREWLKEMQSKGTRTDPIPARFMRPNISNLTLTGELLDSLKGRIIKSKGVVEVFPTGSRSDGLTNQEVAKDLKDLGRVFLGLDKEGVQDIRKIFLDELRRNIKKFEQK